MYELDFDIDEALSELEGMSAKEKIAALEDLCDDFESAIADIQNAQQEIEEQHFASVRKDTFDSVRHLVVNAKYEYVQVAEDACYAPFDGKQVAIFPIYVGGEWSIHIQLASVILKNEARYEFYRKLAEATSTTYKKGDDSIVVKVEEEEVELKIVELVDAIYNG